MTLSQSVEQTVSRKSYKSILYFWIRPVSNAFWIQRGDKERETERDRVKEY